MRLISETIRQPLTEIEQVQLSYTHTHKKNFEAAVQPYLHALKPRIDTVSASIQTWAWNLSRF